MTRLTTQQHHEAPGGTVTVTISTDHALSPAELAALEEIARACRAFGLHHAREPRRLEAEAEAAAEIDVAMWELGGDTGISAG
jgi:hypothetical protein